MADGSPSYFSLRGDGASEVRGTLLLGAWRQLLRWPEARRVESVDYPEANGLQEDLHGGLYDGTPREVQLPVYFKARDFEEARKARFSGNYEFAYYRGRYACTRHDVEELGAGAKVTLHLRELAPPEWLAGAAGYRVADIPRRFAPGVEPLEGLPARARRLGIGCYRARALEGETRKQSPLAELPTASEREALAGRTGLAPRRMMLYCEYAWVIEKRARRAAELLARHGAAFRLFAGRDDVETPLQTLGWALHGARYAGMQVEGFDAAEGILRFTLELLCREARRAE